MIRILQCGIMLLLLLPTAAFAAKTDIVVLKSGDRITGEVKGIEGGLLSFSTDAMGTVNIEWRYIDHVISSVNQSVNMTDGRRLFGRLSATEDSEKIGIETDTGLIEVLAENVFSAWPVENTYWDQSDLDISLGLDYSKSTEIADLSLAVDWSHREPDILTTASLTSDITTRSDADDQKSHQLQFARQYLQPNSRFRSWLANYESNDSLDLDYRIYAGGMFGKYILRRNDRWLSLAGGMIVTEEKFSNTSSQTSLEAAFNMRFNLFRFVDPERTLDLKFTLFPSLTKFGRIRSDVRTTFSLDVTDDLTWSMDVYYQGDSEPPAETAANSDWGVTTYFGWSL